MHNCPPAARKPIGNSHRLGQPGQGEVPAISVAAPPATAEPTAKKNTVRVSGSPRRDSATTCIYAKADAMPESRPIRPANIWFWSRLGRSIMITPANPASTVSTSGPCSAGRGVAAEGRQVKSAPPTRKAAIQTLLM